MTLQTDIDAAIAYLLGTTSSGAAFVKKYSNDWSKWPQTSKWYKALVLLNKAKTEVPAPVNTLKADFEVQ